MSLGDVYRFEVFQTLDQLEIENVFHYRITGETGTGASPSDILAARRFNVEAAWRIRSSVALQIRGYRITKIFPVVESPVDIALSPTIRGIDFGPAAPVQVAAKINWYTGLPGRYRHGRNYLPGLWQERTEGAYATNFYLTAMNLLAQRLMETVIAGTIPNTSTHALCVWSRSHETSTLVTSFICPRRVAACPSRLPPLAPPP